MWRWTFTRYSQIANEEQKKVLGVYIGKFETYTRYSDVADEKKVLRSDCLFKLSKGENLKNELEKPLPKAPKNLSVTESHITRIPFSVLTRTNN